MLLTNGRFSRVISVAATCACVLAGCGVGNHGGVPVAPAIPATSAPTSDRTNAQISFRIDAPNAVPVTATLRRPQYVSPATTQLVLDIEQNGASITGYPKTVALTPTSNGCASTFAATNCTLGVTLVPGSYVASFTAEDASERALSGAQQIPFTAAAGSTSIVNLTLSGIPHEIDIVPGAIAVHGSQAGGLVLYGTAAEPVTVNAKDADGNIIVGPGAPHFAASLLGGVGWSAAMPATTTPNTIALTPPGTNGSNAVFGVAATYGDATCALPGAVCATNFKISNDVQTLFLGTEMGLSSYTQPYTNAPQAVPGAGLPNALAVDSFGNLFVARSVLSDSVAVFAPPYTSAATTSIPFAAGAPVDVALAETTLFVSTIPAKGMSEVSYVTAPYSTSGTPIGSSDGPIASDAAGNLYTSVGNAIVEIRALFSYTAPKVTLATSGIVAPVNLVVDSLGNLFVANGSGTNTIVEIDPTTQTETTISTGVHDPTAMVFDPLGNLFVQNCYSCTANGVSDTIEEFAPPYTAAPKLTITEPASLGFNVTKRFLSQTIALDGMGNLFVASPGLNELLEYAPPYTSVTKTFTYPSKTYPDTVVLTP